METFNNDIMSELLEGRLRAASINEKGWQYSSIDGGTSDGNYINWLTFTGNTKSMLEDVKRIKANSMVPADIPVYGYIYDGKTGELVELSEATQAGKVS